MSYRAYILSPLPTYGIGRMPGGKDVYSSTYQKRSGSAPRKYPTIGGSSNVYSTLCSLPVGPGPLDHTGKKSNSYASSDIRNNSTSSLRSGPSKADHSYQTSSKYEYTPSIGYLPGKYSPLHTALNSTTKDAGNQSKSSRRVSHNDRLSDVDSVTASPRINDTDDTDNDNNKKDSMIDIGAVNSMSQQSSSSSISAFLVGLWLGAALLGGLLAYVGYKFFESCEKERQLSETGGNFNEWRNAEEQTSLKTRIDKTEMRQDKNKCDADENLCKVCLDKMVNTVFTDCGHMVCCTACCEKLSSCPICRKKSKKWIKVYKA